MSDAETAQQTPIIVDCDLLEAAKENVQRLATGRRVTALSEILATPHALRESKLAATRNRLRINVEIALEDEDGDPLEAYCQLVNWTVENYPQGHSAESGLLELLEEATRVLKDDRGGKWRGDIKYLKLWLLYASYVEKPTIVYKFLIANDIGTEFALLYEEHAAVLERDGRRKEADEAYALGIARKAQPLEHLKNRYVDFQKRMMSNIMLPPPAPVASSSSQPARKVLATTASSVPAGASSRPSSSRPTASSGIRPPASNGRMQIFVDPTGAEAEAAEETTNEWSDLGTRKTRIKENAPEVKKMVGTTIKQAGRSKRIAASSSGGAGGSSSKIVPFRDPGPGDEPPRASKKTGGFMPFVDADEDPSPPRAAPKTAQAPKRGFVPFVDDGQDDPSPPALARTVKAPTKGFAPFVDGADDGPSDLPAKKTAPTRGFVPFVDTPEESAVQSDTPKFTPFRDEALASPPVPSAPVAEPVIKVKKADLRAPAPTTEAEALRKDPLKNYGPLRPALDD